MDKEIKYFIDHRLCEANCIRAVATSVLAGPDAKSGCALLIGHSWDVKADCSDVQVIDLKCVPRSIPSDQGGEPVEHTATQNGRKYTR